MELNAETGFFLTKPDLRFDNFQAYDWSVVAKQTLPLVDDPTVHSKWKLINENISESWLR